MTFLYFLSARIETFGNILREETLRLKNDVVVGNSSSEYHSCFISYSEKDEDFAERLEADLSAQGILCWFARRDVVGRRKLFEQISEAILVCEKLLLILSPYSMDSEWVKTEISKARAREAAERKAGLERHILVPVSLVPYAALRDWECFDADIGKD